GTGGNDVFVAETGAEVDVLHFFYRDTALNGYIRGGTHGGASITRRRLYEQFFNLFAGNDFLVQFDVERAAAGKRKLAGFLDDIPQVVIHHFQRELLE